MRDNCIVLKNSLFGAVFFILSGMGNEPENAMHPGRKSPGNPELPEPPAARCLAKTLCPMVKNYSQTEALPAFKK